MIRRRIPVLAALAVAACDVPTAPPMWEQTWAVEGEDIVLGAAELLPAGVTVSPDGTEFQAQTGSAGISATLGEMCPTCGDQVTTPKPAFTHTIALTAALPAALISASATGEAFAVELAHNLGFDPLRPSSAAGAERGFIVIEVTSGGALVGRDSISGDDTAFGSSNVLTPVVPIQPVNVTNVLDIDVLVYSPAGDSAFLQSSDTLGIQLLPSNVTASEVTVEAAALTVDAPAAQLSLAGVDSAMVSRVQSGALRLNVANPFDLTGTLDVRFEMGTESIQKSLTLSTGTYSTSIDFTGAEIRTLLATGDVPVTAAGTLSAADGALTLRPTDVLVMESLLELVILVGGSPGEGE